MSDAKVSDAKVGDEKVGDEKVTDNLYNYNLYIYNFKIIFLSNKRLFYKSCSRKIRNVLIFYNKLRYIYNRNN